jgi:hypothetical protein
MMFVLQGRSPTLHKLFFFSYHNYYNLNLITPSLKFWVLGFALAAILQSFYKLTQLQGKCDRICALKPLKVSFTVHKLFQGLMAQMVNNLAKMAFPDLELKFTLLSSLG